MAFTSSIVCNSYGHTNLIHLDFLIISSIGFPCVLQFSSKQVAQMACDMLVMLSDQAGRLRTHMPETPKKIIEVGLHQMFLCYYCNSKMGEILVNI